MKNAIAYYTIKTGEIPEEYQDTEIPVMVTRQSSLQLRRVVEEFAFYFRKELNYDFVQFEAVDQSDDYRAYLFANPGNEYPRVWAGACCFRKRTLESIGPCWALQWAWLHPYLRRRGILCEAWEKFRRDLGNFFVEPPYSDAMVHFLKKRGICIICWGPLGQSSGVLCIGCLD